MKGPNYVKAVNKPGDSPNTTAARERAKREERLVKYASLVVAQAEQKNVSLAKLNQLMQQLGITPDRFASDVRAVSHYLAAPSDADVDAIHAEVQKRKDAYTELEQRLRAALKARSLAQAEWRRVQSIRSNAERALKPHLKWAIQQGQSRPVGRKPEHAQR